MSARSWKIVPAAVSALLVWSTSTTTALAVEPSARQADARASVDEPRPHARSSPREIGSPALGLAMGEFVGLPYRAVIVHGALALARERSRWAADIDLELGRTERGLSLYRSGVGAGLESPGRLRAGVGARLSYTMVLRTTKSKPFMNALLGDIGGVGIGAQAWLAVDVVKADAFSVGVSLRGVADLYNGGTALRAGALVEASFW